MKRIWKNIDERYAVSNLGEVKRLDSLSINRHHLKEKPLKPQVIGGYLAVYLPDKITGKQKWEYVHRLVANAFIPNPDNLPYVNHKNEVTTDNRVENLEWCTPSYNTQYSLCKSGKLDEDFMSLTEEEKKKYILLKRKEAGKKYRDEHYTPRMNHTIYVYEPVVITTYKLVAQYDNISDAASGLNVSINTVSTKVSRSNKDAKFLRKDGKKLLVTRNIL